MSSIYQLLRKASLSLMILFLKGFHKLLPVPFCFHGHSCVSCLNFLSLSWRPSNMAQVLSLKPADFLVLGHLWLKTLRFTGAFAANMFLGRRLECHMILRSAGDSNSVWTPWTHYTMYIRAQSYGWGGIKYSRDRTFTIHWG